MINETFLSSTPLFQNISAPEIHSLMSCTKAHEKHFAKDQTILQAGDRIHEVGLVMDGSANILVNFYWGDSRIFGHVEKGAIFAENYAAVPDKELLCDVVAAEDTTVLFMDLSEIMTTCGSSCTFHQRLIRNLLQIAATKSLELSSRMMHTAPKSLRERLLSYLSEQAQMQGDAHFTIPFNRQQLADYLGVDRSAMSAELSRMQKDGLITYHKSEFTLL